MAGETDQKGARALLIAGPTASGKSGLAMGLAEKLGGEIVNADSMQIYRELRILTARPDPAAEARVPHHLYGMAGADEDWSAVRWAELAAQMVGEINARGRLALVVGGTGLYFRALTEGFAPVPDIDPEVRAAVRMALAERGAPALHKELQALDPELAARLAPGDGQRIARGLEVARGTGRPLSAWQRENAPALLTGRLGRLALMPEREVLRAQCDARFDAMLAAGALEEVAALGALDLSPDLPAMKALGVPDLLGHLRGEKTLEEAVEGAKAQTRAYAKRQTTWIKGQMISWNSVNTQDLERNIHHIFSFIDDCGLTAG